MTTRITSAALGLITLTATAQEWSVSPAGEMPVGPSNTMVRAITVWHKAFPHAQPVFAAALTNTPAVLRDKVTAWATQQRIVDRANAGDAAARAELQAQDEAARPARERAETLAEADRPAMRRLLIALVEAINARLPANRQITLAEIKQRVEAQP